MYKEKTIGVVVPAYNEERQIGEVLRTIPAFVDRIYPVDDCSTDGTWREVKRVAEELNSRHSSVEGSGDRVSGEGLLADGSATAYKRVRPVRHLENRGVGGAIKTGYRCAYRDGIDVTAVMAGDGQMDPDILDRILDPVVEGRADYAKGNRLLQREDHDNMPRFRFVGNRILTVLTKIASGCWHVGDPQNGYTAISYRALKTIDIDGMYEFYGYCNDLLVTLSLHGLPVTDVPAPVNYGDEVSHISYRSYVPRVSGMLLRNFLRRLRAEYVAPGVHPLIVLYGLGVVGTLLGAARLLNVTSDRVAGERLRSSAVTTLLSVVSILAALLWDRNSNTRPDGGTFGRPPARDGSGVHAGERRTEARGRRTEARERRVRSAPDVQRD
ncbi:MAG: glycosyltransferase family 2 protein [Salinigranum sp.]